MWSDGRRRRNRLKLGTDGRRTCTRRRLKFQIDWRSGWGDMTTCCFVLQTPQNGRGGCNVGTVGPNATRLGEVIEAVERAL
jgi:hypothetical protein